MFDEIQTKKKDTASSGKSNRDFYLDVNIIFKSDLINDMDHMRISGTEPSSVILSQPM